MGRLETASNRWPLPLASVSTACLASRPASPDYRDPRHDNLGARIRAAKLEKVPYILVVGDADVEAGTVGVNARGTDTPERGVTVDDFVDRLAADVLARA